MSEKQIRHCLRFVETFHDSKIVVSLMRQLGNQYGKGFSFANLWNFRLFYLVIPRNDKLYTACRELSWLHVKEKIYIQKDNRDFNPVDFDGFSKEAGLISFTNRKNSGHFFLIFKDDQKGYTLCSLLSCFIQERGWGN